MARKRLVSPEFFQHGDLYDAEVASGLPLRLAFAGLWTQTDRRGLFAWKPRELKFSVLPSDPVDFARVLEALERSGFVERYEVDGKSYGRIPSFSRWQTFHKHEKPSDLPDHPEGRQSPLPAPTQPKTVLGHPKAVEAPPKDDPSTAITGTVAVTGTNAVTVAGAVTGAVTVPAVPAVSDGDDGTGALLTEHDFGPFAGCIVGIVRAARSPAAVLATLRMHLTGEMSHEKATPHELGLAAQQFLAQGGTFNALYFAGFVRRAKEAPPPAAMAPRRPASGPTISEKIKAAEDARQSQIDRYSREARHAGLQWAKSNKAKAQEFFHAADVQFGRDLPKEIQRPDGSSVPNALYIARDAFLTQQFSRAAGFPSFDAWLKRQSDASIPQSVPP